jgi:5-methylcytosine-specific restriction enzyme A
MAPEIKRLYNSQRWKSIRRQQLAEYPWCAECLSHGKHVPAREVDHIHRHRGNAEAFYAGPFQSLCTPCHSRKTANELWHDDDDTPSEKRF